MNGIIDRTFADEDGIRWIVDYKTSYHKGKDINGFLESEVERYQEEQQKSQLRMARLQFHGLTLLLDRQHLTLRKKILHNNQKQRGE